MVSKCPKTDNARERDAGKGVSRDVLSSILQVFKCALINRSANEVTRRQVRIHFRLFCQHAKFSAEVSNSAIFPFNSIHFNSDDHQSLTLDLRALSTKHHAGRICAS